MTNPAERLAAALADRYRIERELGAGGMATVYLAQDLKHDRQVAIKVLKPELAAVLGADRFVVEIKTTAALSHPHILPLFDSGTADGYLYYVMTYIQGETLRAKLDRETQLGIDEAVKITREVADALDYAHRHGVIHRDIKPENILLHDRRALVADFGIALAVQSAAGARMTQTGLSLGTPHYMSPEQAMGEKQIDARSDIYALGAMLYEMLTGDPPFTGSTVQAVVAKVMSAEPEPVTMLRKSTPEPVAYAVHKALEKLPADRFATAQEFADALVAPVGVRGANTSHARNGSRAGNWRATLRQPATLGFAVVAIAALALAVRERGGAARAADATVQRFTLDAPPGVQADVQRQSALNLAVSPDGSVVVFAGIDADGTRRLFARRLDELEAHPLPGTEGAQQAFFSPDGRSVAFWVAGRLLKVSLSGGPPQRITDLPNMIGATWTTSGTIVAGVNNRLVWFPADEGTTQRTSTLDTAHTETSQFFPVALPDGDHVVYASWGAGGLERVNLGMLSLSTGQSRRLDIAGLGALGMADGALIFANALGGLSAVPFNVAAGKETGPVVAVVNNVANGNRGGVLAALSRSGTLVYATGNLLSQLVPADSNGETPVIPEFREYAFPRYSPDGKRLAVSIGLGTTRDVWLYDFASHGLRRLTSGGSFNERPEWSADGARVLFRTDRGPRSAIWWQPIDESAPATPLLSGAKTPYYEAVMTPDGKAIVYQVDTTGGDIDYRMLGGDTSAKPFADTPAQELEPRVSPDGHWLAYLTDHSGTNQVVVQPFPGPGARIPISPDGGTEPVWARDGRHLFYRGPRDFVDVAYATTPSFRVVSRANFMVDNYINTLAPHAGYDVSPDGRKLLVLKSVPQRVVVVHNWSSEVRARLRGDSTR